MDWDINVHRPLRELVYGDLKMKILRGEIAPGTRMMEVQLAEEMGVSRTPIREAIRELEKDGLVTIEPRRGAYASMISLRDMLDILEVREDIEGLAAGFAAERIDDATREKLCETAEKYDKAVRANITRDMIKYDTEFHHLIVEGSGNKVLVSMVEQIHEFVLRFRYLYYDDFRRVNKMPTEHRHILRAILEGNSAEAREAAEKHVDQLKKVVENENAFASKKTIL